MTCDQPSSVWGWKVNDRGGEGCEAWPMGEMGKKDDGEFINGGGGGWKGKEGKRGLQTGIKANRKKHFF